MLRLNLGRQPRWHDLASGVRVLCAPVTTTVLNDARRSIAEAGLAPPQVSLAAAGEDTPRLSRAQTDALTEAMVRALARAVILEWEGIGDAEGAPIDPTPDGIEALLDLHLMFEAFQLKVVAPAMLLVTEKNGSAPSPNGITTGAQNTATDAGKPARTARRA